jgi:hypothetical protein
VKTETIGKIISAVVGLALVGGGVYLLAIESEHAETLIAAGLTIVGGLGTILSRGVRGSSPPPDSGSGGGGAALVPLAFALGFAVAASSLSACGGVPRPLRLGVEQLAVGIDRADEITADYVRNRGEESRREVLERVVAGAVASIDAGMALFDDLMRPALDAVSVLVTARRALEGVEHGLDAWDAGAGESDFLAAAACGVVALADVVGAFESAGLELPDEIAEGVTLLSTYATLACPPPRLAALRGAS